MKNKILIISLSLIVAIGVGAGVFILIRNSDGINSKESSLSSGTEEIDPEDIIAGQPYLVMKITDYPKSIANRCQAVSFTFEAENIGDTALKYSDLESNYYFGIVSDDAVSGFENGSLLGTIDMSKDYVDDAGILPYTKVVNDFGEISPGEKETIVFKSINYVVEDQHQYYWINSFNNVSNGKYNYSIEFGKLSEKGMYFSSGISQSEPVSITTDLYDSNGGWKYCEYNVITDKSVDFYE